MPSTQAVAAASSVFIRAASRRTKSSFLRRSVIAFLLTNPRPPVLASTWKVGYAVCVTRRCRLSTARSHLTSHKETEFLRDNYKQLDNWIVHAQRRDAQHVADRGLS